MSETRDPDLPAEAEQEGTEQAVRAMLRGARGGEEEEAPDLVRGVQQKIRVRSGGKFYADGWSTVKHPPLATYLITSLLMLFVLIVIYALLAPLSGPPELARPPKAVQIVVPVGQ
jgi:hypothetical protein